MVDICYPDGADWLCAYTQEELDEIAADPDKKRVADRADALAWSTLSALLGYRLSLCPVVLRPCLAGCGYGGTWDEAPVRTSAFQTPFGGPYISGGRWYNACGCTGDCSCTSLCEVIMPSPVGGIASVALDGVDLLPSAYRVDNGNRLVRTDGECWPVCQDMTKPSGPTYETTIISNLTNTLTITREGQLVQVLVEPTDLIQGGNFAGALPWVPKGGSQTTVPLSGGGDAGVFVLSAGSAVIGGSAGPNFAPFRVVFETSDAPASDDHIGSFIVSYYPHLAPNDLLRYAAGVLATEYYKACSGKQCRLPNGVTSITRNGISMEIPSGLFPNGATGLREVDPIIRIYNPNGLKMPSRVLSPDSPRARVQTWGG